MYQLLKLLNKAIQLKFQMQLITVYYVQPFHGKIN
jgi:hypothetical protein